MSQELIDSLNRRVTELEKKNSDLNVALRVERKDYKALKTEHDTLLANAETEFGESDAKLAAVTRERDEWQAKATAAPSEQAARIGELEGSLRKRDYKDAFREAVTDLAPGIEIEDLWHFGGFDPAKAETLDPAQITELVGKVRTAKPSLFGTPAAPGNGAPPPKGEGPPAPKPPLKVGSEASRGARDTASGTLRYKASDLAVPGWMTTNPALAKAIADKTATLVDE